MDRVKGPRWREVQEISGDQAEGRPEELAGSAPDEESRVVAGTTEIADARRAEALANPEVAADEANKVIATPVPGAREEEALAANPDEQEEEAERVLQRTAKATEDERSAEDVKKQG